MKKFVQISAPRTGSNMICESINICDRISVKYEIFHDKAFIIKELAQEVIKKNKCADRKPLQFCRDLAKINKESKWDKKSIFSKQCPAEFINEYASCMNFENFYFKVFPGHLAQDQIEKILKAMDGVIFTERTVLDSYISYEKAQSNNLWSNQDTSGIKIRFDKNRYEWFKDKFIKPKNEIKDFVKFHKIPFFVIDYDEVPKESMSIQVDWIKSEFLSAFDLDLGEACLEDRFFVKQDKVNYYFKKFKNPKEFRQYYNKVIIHELDKK